MKDKSLVMLRTFLFSEFQSLIAAYVSVFFTPDLSNEGEMEIIALTSIIMMIVTVAPKTKVIINIAIHTFVDKHTAGESSS